MILCRSPKLAVAFDFNSREEVFELSKELEGLPVVIKLGLGVLPFLNQKDFSLLKDQGFELFIDMKLHDIPSQVARAVSTWGNFGAKYLTLHTGGATQMMSEAVNAAKDFDLTLLGVTVLTSLKDSHLSEIGWSKSRSEQVSFLTEQGLRAGMRGFVCPPSEIKQLKQQAKDLGFEGVVSCNPGLVYDKNEKRFDQPHVWTVREAVDVGSDLLVVGRSVLQASDRKELTCKILKEIGELKS